MKYDSSKDNNEKNTQTEKKEEENLYKEHKIETKKEIGEKRNIKEITKKGYNKY